MYGYWVYETLEVITACIWAARGTIPFENIMKGMSEAYIEDSERF